MTNQIINADALAALKGDSEAAKRIDGFLPVDTDTGLFE